MIFKELEYYTGMISNRDEVTHNERKKLAGRALDP